MYKQSFKGIKGLDKEELSNQLETTTNRRLPLLNWSYYTTIYHIGENSYKPEKAIARRERIKEKYNQKLKNQNNKRAKYISKKNKKLAKVDRLLKEGNFFMRWGEKVQVYDSTKELESVRSLKDYMSTLGFFDAKVDFQTQIYGKKAEVTYIVDRGNPYIIDSVLYNIKDPKLKNLVKSNPDESKVKKGNVYKQENLTEERKRLTNKFNNEGYYTFSQQYISFQVDTTVLKNNKVLVQLTVANPIDKLQHKQYTIDSVIFISNASQRNANPIIQKTHYNGITFVYGKRLFSPKILDWRLFLYPDSLYRKRNFFETQRQISNLDIFKFVNIKNDTTGGGFVTSIITSPLKKYQTSNEIGINVNQGLPGPFFNVSLKNRNSFRALEILELSGKLGVEGVPSATDDRETYSSIEYGATLSQTFPQFLFPFSKEYRSKVGKLNPTTKFATGLNYVDRPEYIRNNLFGSVTYSWQKGKEKLFSFKPVEVSFIESRIQDPRFDTLLINLNRGNDRLINAFKSSFVSSASFVKTLNLNTYGNRKENSYYAKFDFESGGALLDFFGSNPIVDTTFQTFQYLRFITDLRAVVPVTKRRLTVYRISLGAAYSYGESGTLPYEKFLFAGGSNGIRAWQPRRLGPGSYQQETNPQDPESDEITQDFEQPATLLFEANLESRFKMFSFFEGAFFMDFGNTWLLQKNDAKPGGAFSFRTFYKEIAIGTGFGLRLDFSLLVLRLDLGIKVHDPFRDLGDRFIWDKGFSKERYKSSSPTVLNIGIGYPF